MSGYANPYNHKVTCSCGRLDCSACAAYKRDGERFSHLKPKKQNEWLKAQGDKAAYKQQQEALIRSREQQRRDEQCSIC